MVVRVSRIAVVKMVELVIQKQVFASVRRVGREQYVLIGVHLDCGELTVLSLVIVTMEHLVII